MPESAATHAELVFRHCHEVARFVRPFVVDAEAAREYVRRTFARAYVVEVHREVEPETALARIALHEVARACPPQGSLWPMLDSLDEIDRAAFVLVWVQELPLYRVASVLGLSLGKLLRRAEQAAHRFVARVELESLATGGRAPGLGECLETLRRDLDLSWSNADRMQIASEVIAELDQGFPALSMGRHALQRAPFPRPALEPAPLAPPAAKSSHEVETSANRNARRHVLRDVRALAAAPRKLADSGTLALRELCAALRPATPLPFAWIPPNPARAPRARRRRTAMPLVVASLFGVVVAQAAPALFPARAPLAALMPTQESHARPRRPLVQIMTPHPTAPRTTVPLAEEEAVVTPSPARRTLVHGAHVVAPVSAPPSEHAPAAVAVVAPESPLSLQEAMERATGGVAKPANDPLPEPGVASTRRPSVGAALVAVGKVKDRARACLGIDDAPSRATVVFRPSGAVSSVVVTGPASFTPKSRCIEAALGAARVPPFTEDAFSAALTIRP